MASEGQAEGVAAAKRTMHLTDDNWADYFSDDYPASLVKGFKVQEGGIDRDDPIVTLGAIARRLRRAGQDGRWCV